MDSCYFPFYSAVLITPSQPGNLYISLSGRYNKYSRNLPQTPWIIDGERKLESSVEELISDHLLKVFKAESKCYNIHILNTCSQIDLLEVAGKISGFCKPPPSLGPLPGSFLWTGIAMSWAPLPTAGFEPSCPKISLFSQDNCLFLGKFKTIETTLNECT